MLKAYRYKLEPNQSQRSALARTLDVCRELYNDCLFQRKLQPALQGGEVQSSFFMSSSLTS